MSADVNDVRQSIEELVQHPGWHLFVAAMGKEWGSEAVLDRLAVTVNRMKEPNASQSSDEFLKLLNARELIRHAIDWPHRQLANMRGKPATATTIMRRA